VKTLLVKSSKINDYLPRFHGEERKNSTRNTQETPSLCEGSCSHEILIIAPIPHKVIKISFKIFLDLDYDPQPVKM